MRGQCLCGAVEFEIVGALPGLYQCHCSLCRKQGGSASNTATIVAEENFRWLAGQGHIASYVKPTGFRSDFCRHCGSPVPNPLRGSPYVWVPAGLLEDIGKSDIRAHLHVASKAQWDTLPTSGEHFETMPGLAELVALLHGPGDA